MGDYDSPLAGSPPWQHRFADVGGVRLHYVEAGRGPLVLLLHGFPEFWYAWRRQLSTLAGAGFRVVAPDLRGYGGSDKPRGIEAYAVRRMVGDVRGLIEQLGARSASLVGHDWGGAVAWEFGMRYPELLERLVIVNCPHPLRFMRGLLTRRQMVRSWYMFFFQLPRLPEAVLRRSGYAALLRPFEQLPAAARLRPEEREAYLEAFRVPGALTAMLNYYRAAFRPRTMVRPAPIGAEVLVLWGERDVFLGRELAEPDPRWVPRARVEYLPAGHFVQHELPDEISHRLIAFLAPAARSDRVSPTPARA